MIVLVNGGNNGDGDDADGLKYCFLETNPGFFHPFLIRLHEHKLLVYVLLFRKL